MSNIKTKRCPSKYQNYSYTGPHDAVPPDYSNITKKILLFGNKQKLTSKNISSRDLNKNML